MNEPEHRRKTIVLVEQARRGDREAYDRLFALSADRVLQFIRMRLGSGLRSKVESMDILQEAYLAAHRDFERFEYRGDDAFARWLCRIVENRIRGEADYFGAGKRRNPGAAPPVSAVLSRIRAQGSGVVTGAARLEERARLEAAMAGLAEREREALLLRYWQGRTIDEIAGLTGRSPTSVRRILGRAVLRLGGRIAGRTEADRPGAGREEEDRHAS